MTEFGRVITQNEHNLHNGNFSFVEEISKRKIPLGTKGCTSILSIESSASCGASFSVSRRKLHDLECCVTPFRQGGWSRLPARSALQSVSRFEVSTGDPRPPCTANAAIPLWTCRPQTVLTNRSPPAGLQIRHKQILRMI